MAMKQNILSRKVNFIKCVPLKIRWGLCRLRMDGNLNLTCDSGVSVCVSFVSSDCKDRGRVGNTKSFYWHQKGGSN